MSKSIIICNMNMSIFLPSYIPPICLHYSDLPLKSNQIHLPRISEYLGLFSC